MRIPNAYTKLDQAALTRGPGAAGKPSADGAVTSSKGAAGAVDVRLSEQAQSLASAAPSRAERLDALRSAIQSGSFTVDAHRIASKLVGEVEP